MVIGAIERPLQLREESLNGVRGHVATDELPVRVVDNLMREGLLTDGQVRAERVGHQVCDPAVAPKPIRALKVHCPPVRGERGGTSWESSD